MMDSEDGQFFIKVLTISLDDGAPFADLLELGSVCAHARKGLGQCLAAPSPVLLLLRRLPLRLRFHHNKPVGRSGAALEMGGTSDQIRQAGPDTSSSFLPPLPL